MLPYQIRRNCEKFVYAHNIVNASMRLPRSRKWLGLRISCSAPVPDSRQRNRVTNANADSPAPTVNEMPNIDEYHFGSSDITQSTEQSVSDSTIMSSPAALHRRRDSSVYGERVFAKSSERKRMRQAHSVQSAK